MRLLRRRLAAGFVRDLEMLRLPLRYNKVLAQMGTKPPCVKRLGPPIPRRIVVCFRFAFRAGRDCCERHGDALGAVYFFPTAIAIVAAAASKRYRLPVSRHDCARLCDRPGGEPFSRT